MNFYRAMEALEDGKKVRCKGWPENDYIYRNADDGLFYGSDGKACSLLIELSTTKDCFDIYEEPVKLMSFIEACLLIDAGKTVKRKGWDMKFIHGGPYLFIFRNGGYFKWLPKIDDILAIDWVEVTHA